MASTASAQPIVRQGPFYGIFLLGICGLIAGLQGAMYLSMIERTVGTIPFITKPSPAAARIPKFEVAILKSRATSRLNAEHPEYYFDLSLQWEMALKESGIPFRTIHDEDLAGGLEPSSGILVLPMVQCLSDSQKRSIRKFLAGGGGLVATGPLGVRDENGKWLGWDYLQEITALKNVTMVPQEERTYAVFRGNQYYSGSVPPGYRLELPRQELIAGKAVTPDLFAGD
jgi:hypothetical protein